MNRRARVKRSMGSRRLTGLSDGSRLRPSALRSFPCLSSCKGQMRARQIALALLASVRLWAADSQWVLERSTLTYHVSHPLHQMDGVSHAARGKGVCHDGECNFLIAVPVKSFDSGDSNRDLHMLQVTRGAEFPIVSVRTQIPEAAANSSVLRLNLEVQFAGQTATYKDVPFERTVQGSDVRISGTIPAKVSDFKIDPPSLLALPIKNDIPIHVDTTWTDRAGATRSSAE